MLFHHVFLYGQGILATLAAGEESQDTFLQRRAKLSRRDEIDFSKFPKCAKPYCNSTAAMSPSRLGCIDDTLTKKCLCEEAVIPLDCVPSGPSSEDNCWYDVEDWFAGQCNESVATVPASSMPSCLVDCATNWLRAEGCRADTRNCLCKLVDKEVVDAVEGCRKTSCMKHMQPGFDSAFWREQICSQGEVDDYDESAYRKRKKLVKNVQIVVPIFLVIVVLIVCGCGVGLCMEDSKSGDYLAFWGFVLFILAICLILLVIPPIFVAI